MPVKATLPTLFVVLALGGCSSDGAQVTPDSRAAGQDGRATSREAGAPPDITRPAPDTVPPKTAKVCGTLERLSGSAGADHTVLVCSDTNGCSSDTSSASGKFCLPLEFSGDYMLQVINEVKAGKHYIQVYLPVTVTKADIAAENKIQIGTIVVPHMARALQKVDMAKGGTFDLGDGVSLTIGAGISKKPPLESDLRIGAAALKKSQANPRYGTHYKGSDTLHMAVAFHPLETTFTKPVPFRFPALGLSPGASVEVYFLGEKDGKLTKAADGKESGGSIVSAAGQGLKNLGVLLVYAK